MILKEQVGKLFTDRLTFIQTTPTFNKLKLLLLMTSEYCLLQRAAKFCPSNTEVAILDTILSANGARQRAGENYFCSTNHMCDTMQGKK